MSRRPPSDTFTRFTSTTPHAAQSTSSTSRQSIASSNPQRFTHPAGPDGETPAQKVARLRAANRLAKAQSQLSFTDRLISRGRIYADVTHRLAAYSLFLITGVSSVVAVYGLVSLVSHNRRQKRAWIEREMDRLHQAQQAFLRGEADAEQLHLLEQERAGEEMARQFQEEKKKRKAEGIFGRIKGTFGSFTSSGDMGVESTRSIEAAQRVQTDSQGRERLLSEGWVDGEVATTSAGLKPVAVQESGISGVGLDAKGRPVPINQVQKVSQSISEERRSGERAVTERTGITGGPLDVLAGNVASAVIPQSSQSSSSAGWFSWISGGRKSS